VFRSSARKRSILSLRKLRFRTASPLLHPLTQNLKTWKILKLKNTSFSYLEISMQNKKTAERYILLPFLFEINLKKRRAFAIKKYFQYFFI